MGLYRHVSTEVGSFPPNAFGLCDMHGNLWEWCLDPWHEDYRGAPADGRAWEAGGHKSLRVLRGGSWHDTPDVCRSAVRLKLPHGDGDDFCGFRVALEG
jgi:formylglycine-generating enzyme required for sulfatase activity